MLHTLTLTLTLSDMIFKIIIGFKMDLLDFDPIVILKATSGSVGVGEWESGSVCSIFRFKKCFSICP